jgi:hypothetical protein
MYGQILGASTVVGAGGILLPDTGGNVLLTVLSITAIAVGGAVLLSTAARAIAKKGFRA